MTAIPTRVRQLVNGVWQYVTFDEGGGGGSQPSVLYRTTTFNTAELLAATNLILVPAPGANKIIVPSLVVGFIHAGATPFAMATGAALYVGADNNSNWSSNWLGFKGIVESAVDAVDSIDFGFETLDGDGYTLATDIVNQPFGLFCSAPITDGDGSVTLIATYAVFDVS